MTIFIVFAGLIVLLLTGMPVFAALGLALVQSVNAPLGTVVALLVALTLLDGEVLASEPWPAGRRWALALGAPLAGLALTLLSCGALFGVFAAIDAVSA